MYKCCFQALCKHMEMPIILLTITKLWFSRLHFIKKLPTVHNHLITIKQFFEFLLWWALIIKQIRQNLYPVVSHNSLGKIHMCTII